LDCTWFFFQNYRGRRERERDEISGSGLYDSLLHVSRIKVAEVVNGYIFIWNKGLNRSFSNFNNCKIDSEIYFKLVLHVLNCNSVFPSTKLGNDGTLNPKFCDETLRSINEVYCSDPIIWIFFSFFSFLKWIRNTFDQLRGTRWSPEIMIFWHMYESIYLFIILRFRVFFKKISSCKWVPSFP
jgi:hypothetical protein